MTRCLSCGYVRQDLVLNCPKCGSFYSTFEAYPPTEAKKNTAQKHTNDGSTTTNKSAATKNHNAAITNKGSAITNDSSTAVKKSSPKSETMGFFEWLRQSVEIQIKYIIITIGILIMLTIRVVLCL